MFVHTCYTCGMKLIFLDFDGVINSLQYARMTPQIDMMCTAHDLDPIAVDRIKKLMKMSGAKIVVSSSWRIVLTLPELQDVLGHFGVDRHGILGVTPRIHGERGFEIEKFVKLWPLGQDYVQSFVIIDDSNDMGNLHHRHVHTTYNHGFLDEHIDEAMKILAEPWESKLEIP